MTANFVLGDDGIERVSKRVQLHLTREENRFCIEQTGQGHLPANAGGGEAVDQYLRDIIFEELHRRISAAR